MRTICLKGVAASYDEYVAMIKSRKAQGLSVELTERDKLQTFIGSGIRDAEDVFTIMHRYVYVRTDDCVVDGHSCSLSCVDERVDRGCDCVPGFQMEVLSGERCAETVCAVGLMREK